MKYIFILLSFVIVLSKSFAQSNSIGITYTPAITKVRMTDVRAFSDNVFTDVYKVWYDTKKPTESAYGYNLGLTYKRKLKGDTFIGLGIFYTNLKTNSGNFFQVKGLREYHPNYGGVEYFIKYTGLEAPIELYYQIYKKGKIVLNVNTGLSFNLIGQFTVQDYLIDKFSGIKRKTFNESTISDGHFRYYWDKLYEKRNQRIGLFLGVYLSYQLSKAISVSFSPTIKYYSNALEKSYSVDALRADAFLLGLQSQINFNF